MGEYHYARTIQHANYDETPPNFSGNVETFQTHSGKLQDYGTPTHLPTRGV
jgi:hypothetical protein